MKTPEFRPYHEFKYFSANEMEGRSEGIYNELNCRRTVREFSSKFVADEVIKNCIKAAGTAPSGANLQPWTFVAVKDPEVKKEIREKAEIEEREFYQHRAPEEWLQALEPFATNEHKPFLETAPWLIAIFVQKYSISGSEKRTHYYANESVGIATGMLISALHHAGLVSLTHTPSPMKFLNAILERPDNEKPFLLLVTGYPADNVKVPDINRKPFNEIAKIV